MRRAKPPLNHPESEKIKGVTSDGWIGSRVAVIIRTNSTRRDPF